MSKTLGLGPSPSRPSPAGGRFRRLDPLGLGDIDRSGAYGAFFDRLRATPAEVDEDFLRSTLDAADGRGRTTLESTREAHAVIDVLVRDEPMRRVLEAYLAGRLRASIEPDDAPFLARCVFHLRSTAPELLTELSRLLTRGAPEVAADVARTLRHAATRGSRKLPTAVLQQINEVLRTELDGLSVDPVASQARWNESVGALFAENRSAFGARTPGRRLLPPLMQLKLGRDRERALEASMRSGGALIGHSWANVPISNGTDEARSLFELKEDLLGSLAEAALAKADLATLGSGLGALLSRPSEGPVLQGLAALVASRTGHTDPAILQKIISLLESPYEALRSKAAQALGTAGVATTEVIEALRRVARRELRATSRDVCSARSALDALGRPFRFYHHVVV